MINSLKNWFRRRVRSRQWANNYPFVLPHVRLAGDTAHFPGGGSRFIPPAHQRMIGLADGTRTLQAIAREARGSASELLRLHDEDVVGLWHSPIMIEDEPPSPSLIVISPHPDDAPLSAGGNLINRQLARYAQGGILILDIFTRTNWWRLPRKPNDQSDINAARMEEELTVARLLNARLDLLNQPEALLRGRSMDSVFTAHENDADRESIAAIEHRVSELVSQYPLSHWLLPLGIGNHLDHRIARDAALRVLTSAGIPAKQIAFYEDLPYANEAGVGVSYTKFLPGLTLAPRLVDINHAMRWKLQLNRVYWTQFTWSRIEPLETYAWELNEESPAERVWEING